jgi:hypothetical protein
MKIKLKMKNKMRYKDETLTVTLKKTLLVIDCLDFGESGRERERESAREENAEREGGGNFLFLFFCSVVKSTMVWCNSAIERGKIVMISRRDAPHVTWILVPAPASSPLQ